MKQLARQSLRFKLFALIFLTVLPAFGLIIYDAVKDDQNAIAIKESASQIIDRAARNHDEAIHGAHDILNLLTRMPSVLLDAPACERWLKDLRTEQSTFGNIAVISPTGEVMCSARPENLRVNYADRQWFKQAISGQSLVSSEYLVGRVIPSPTVVLAAPLYDSSRVTRGVVGISMRLDWILRLAENIQLSPRSMFALLDQQGTVLVRHPQTSSRPDKAGTDAILARSVLAQPRQTIIEHTDPDGVERVYVVRHLGKSSNEQAWYLALGIPKATVYGQTYVNLRQDLLFMSGVAILALAVAWWGSALVIVRPLRSLVAAAARLGKGDFSARSGMTQRQDEIGQLSGAFDQMASALEMRDIDRQRADATDARLAALVESSNDAIIGRTLDGITTSWNKGAERLFGYSADEMIGQSVLLLVPEDKIELSKINFARIARGERIDTYETVRLKKGGALVDVSVAVSPIFDKSGAVVGASSITRDITLRKQTERELQVLHELNMEITSTLDLPTVLQTLLEKIATPLPYAAAQIRLVNKETGRLERLAYRGIDEVWKFHDDQPPHPVIDKIIQTKRPLAVSDLHSDERLRRREFYLAQGLVSYLGVPVIAKGEAIGVLSLFTNQRHVFTEREIAFAKTLVKQASIAIANARLYEETKRLSEKLAANDAEIHKLANGLIKARDEEAKRIAHTLHDESGQLLALVYIALDSLSSQLTGPVKTRVQEIKVLLDGVENRLRELSHELHPAMLDHLGLLPAIEHLTSQVSQRAGIPINFSSYLDERLPPLLELTLFRVLQEALNNIVRHAHARTVDIRIIQDEDWIQCAIQDDGSGFDPKAAAQKQTFSGQGLGLPGMRERVEAIGGNLEILSAPGQGTKLFVSVRREERRDAELTACR